MKEIFSTVKTDLIVKPQVTSGTTAVSGEITLDGSFDSLTLAVLFGTPGIELGDTNNFSVKLEEYLSGEYKPASACNVIGLTPDSSGVVAVFKGAKEEVIEFAYSGIADKLKVTVTPAGVHATGTSVGVAAVKGNWRFAPPERSSAND